MRRVWQIAIVVVAVFSMARAGAQNTQDDKRIQLADPFILLHNNTYYAYGTHSRNGIEVYTSKNLKEWSYGGLALNKEDSYGDRWFWAPEVYHINGKFYMYYTADKHICVATSDYPSGPFEQQDFAPILPDNNIIDNTLFVDDDGTPYMLYVVINKGFTIYVAELESDLATIKPSTITPCIRPKQRWERMEGKVNEGPSILKHKGTYFLLYSGNGYKSQKYGIGYATAKSIKGPWKKSSDNPILQFPGELVGSGHGAPFYDKRGRLHYVFHAHYSKEKVHPRCMYITRMNIKGDKLHISDRYFTPIRIK